MTTETALPAIERLATEEALEIEHGQLGVDDETVPLLAAGAVSAALTATSRLRGATTRLEIVDGRGLRVAVHRRGRAVQSYVVDLRFVDPQPVHQVSLARGWLGAAIVCSLAAILPRPPGVRALTEFAWSPGLSVALIAGALVAAGVAGYRSRAALAFLSLHGRAPLATLAGLWRRRAVAHFERALRQQVDACVARTAQPRAHLLRDEMREHSRLREAGVLTHAQYEASRVRILRAHG